MKHFKEHRWNFRKQVNTMVILNTPGLGVIQAETRDVSYGGARLDTTPLILSPNTKVRMTFIVREDAGVTRQAIDGRVVYMNARGCGLVFEGFHRETFTFLHRLMRVEADAAAPAAKSGSGTRVTSNSSPRGMPVNLWPNATARRRAS